MQLQYVVCFLCWAALATWQVHGKQRFRTRPQNVSAIQDQTVIMKCEVVERVGAMQWSKDGFALGMDPAIPGFSRYEVVGNLDLGEYNLMITNVELGDDAEYQCQVMPAKGNGPLMASAYLTVHIPPDVPEIVGFSNGSIIEIPSTQDILKLTCIAHNGRPAAQLEWFKDGEKITNGVERKVISKPNQKRMTAKSILTYRPQYIYKDNDAYLSCQAFNDAVRGPPLETVVQLSISFPPDPPEISGYQEGQVVRTGDTLRLLCVSRGGNPLAHVVWYKNDRELDQSYVTGQNKAENELTIMPVQTSDNDAIFRCEASNVATPKPLVASFKLTVHYSDYKIIGNIASADLAVIIKPEDNNAVYVCKATNNATVKPLVTKVRLKVYFPPKKVKISGHRLAKAGETVTLKCESSNSNPAASITWFARGRQLPEDNTQVKTAPKGGFISTSITKVNLTGNENNVMYTCQAKNEYINQAVTDSVTLSVLYPPANPKITGYKEGSSINSGDLKRLTCTAVGGNPLASLKWYKSSQRLDSDYKIIGNIASADLAVIIKPEDNNAVYVCKATNNATVKPLVTKVRLKVYFPPLSVNITTNPKVAKAGLKFSLRCESSSSNPEAEIIWLRDGQQLTDVNGADVAVKNGTNGGKITINVMDIMPSAEDHLAVYGCRATNIAWDQSVNDGMTLNVLFKPTFSPLVPRKISILEGNWKLINFTSRANPPKVTYSLWRDGQELKLSDTYPHFNLDEDGVLNITKAAQKDSGYFQMKAVNAEGTAYFNFTLNIQYPASITTITTPIMKDEGGMAYLVCNANANPKVDNMVQWSRDNYDMSKTRQMYDNGTSYLTVYELSRTDTGTFTCSAYNGFGKVVTRVAQLIVKYPPQIDKAPKYAKAASDKGGTATLLCKADGAPIVTFTWSKGSTELTDTAKYKIKTTKREDVNYISTLEVANVTKEDYGTYACKASNEKGTASFSILLDVTSKPDPPYDIKFVNATHDSITLTWQPGFDGGMEQAFRIRYRPTGAPNYKYVDIGTGINVYTLAGLQLGTEYMLTMLAFNKLGESEFQIKEFKARTSSVAPPEDSDPSALQGSDDMPVIIILVVCIVGIFLLALNIGLIMFFIRRKRKRLERYLESIALQSSNHSGTNEMIPRQRDGSDTTSHTNTFELFGSTKESHLYPMSPSEDARSYDTYDKSIDEFSDECSKNYEDEDMKRVFLPPHDYSGRPYTPCKQDSPQVEPKRAYMDSPNRQITYLDDSGSRSPIHEDLYMAPKKKTEGYETNHYGVLQGKTTSGTLYEDPSSWSRQEQNNSRMRNGMVADYIERPANRPCSRAGKTPPPPPVRTSSRGPTDSTAAATFLENHAPPLPARLYGSQDLPHFAPSSAISTISYPVDPPQHRIPPARVIASPPIRHPHGPSLSLSPNIVPNPSYESPPRSRCPTPRGSLQQPTQANLEMKGHLV